MDIEINKLIEINNKKFEDKYILYNYFEDDKILDIYRHKLIECTINNTKQIIGGEQKNKYKNKIKKMDKKILLALYTYYDYNINKIKINLKNIINYILKKYNFDNITTFYIGENITNYENEIKIDYFNTYPKKDITFEKIFISSKIRFDTLKKNINIFDNYISFILSKYLKNNGSMIIRMHLIFDNSNFINFIKQLCRKFLSINIIYAKKFMQMSPIGYIILHNKSNDILCIDNKFNKIIEKYIKKFKKYILKSLELTHKMIQLNTVDNNAFEIFCNKIKYKIQY